MKNNDDDNLPPHEPRHPPERQDPTPSADGDSRRRRRRPRDAKAIAAAWSVWRRHGSHRHPAASRLPVRTLETTAVLAYGAWTALVLTWLATH